MTDSAPVFVHGLPETSRIWDSLRKILDRDSIALALPGFGTPRPKGFTATKDAYAEWLANTLTRIKRPIDLVGHDIGALISLRVATVFDVPLHSFIVDVAPIFHPNSVWPERVQRLQTPASAKTYSGRCARPTPRTRTAPPPDSPEQACQLARLEP